MIIAYFSLDGIEFGVSDSGSRNRHLIVECSCLVSVLHRYVMTFSCFCTFKFIYKMFYTTIFFVSFFKISLLYFGDWGFLYNIVKDNIHSLFTYDN